MTELPETPAEIDAAETPLAHGEPAPSSTYQLLVRLGLVYAASLVVLWIIQSGTKAIIDPDGYYHIRWSRLLWENLPKGQLPRFVWLPLTTLNENAYVDHHFLFHILQIPFTWGPNLVAGAKASAVVFGALAVLACYLLVSWERVRYPSFWFLGLLACSAPYLFRLSLPRAPSVTIVTLCLALWLLWTRRTIWLGVLAFALVWMYSLFPLIGVLAGFWAIGVFIEERRIEWKPVVAVTVGVVVGLIVNPYFPENLYLFAAHVLMKTKEDFEIGVGNEWYPYETWYLFTSSAVAFVAQAVGYVATQRGEREGRARTITLLLFSTLLLVLTFKSRRFIEYWPAFAVLFAAFAMRPHLDRWPLASIPGVWVRRSVAAAGVALTLAIFAILVQNVRVTRATVSGETNPYAYVGGTEWLKANTPEGALVFNTDWDDFPMLFHHDTHNVYTSGLDPTYLLYADPELSRLYVDITLGKQDDPAPLIRDRFGAKWAFTDSGHRDFLREATKDGKMRIVYEDDDCVVLEVVDPPPAVETEGLSAMVAQPATASRDDESGLAVRARRIAHVVLAVALVGLVLGYVQAQTYGIIGADGYYHIKWSRLLWEGFLRGEIPEFTWLPLTILDAPRYVDHHFLFHILQIPFTWFGDLIVGAKLSAFVYGVAAMLACYGLIVQSRVRWPLVWLVALLASSSHFMWRMTNPRAMSVTIVTLVLAIWLLFAKRYRWVGVLAFALVWMYSLFPLLLVLAVAWTIGDWWESRRLDWRPVAFASIGIALGLLINPYFPENIALFIDHAWMKVAEDSTVPVGAEWYPLATWSVVTMSTVTLVAQIGGLLCVRPEHRESSARTICLLLFSTFLALLAFKSRRFMEYWPPFAVVFFAVAAAPWLDRVRVNELARSWRVAVVSAAVSVAIVMAIMLFVVLDQTLKIDQPPDSPVVYAGAARWLTENTPPSSLVFNADWDDFPMLFFHDSHNAYVSGLDPTYLLYANRESAEEYGRICAGEVQDPGRLISGRFGARFAVSAKDVEHDEFIRRARADRSMKSVFEDDHAVVFEILP